MPLIFESFNVLSDQARAELRRQISAIDPTIFGSFARPFLDSAAALAYTNSLTIRDLEQQLFPQTAQGEFLDRWGGYEALARNPASKATGNVNLSGTNGTVIAAATLFDGANGLVYQSTSVTTIQVVSISVASITRSGTTATVTISSDHNLATGQSATIAGAGEAEYNGTFTIIVTTRTQFTYTVSGSPATPATGTITAADTYAIVPCESQDTGQTTNLDSGAVLTLQTAIVGANASGFANVDGLSGGAAEEEDATYRTRILLSRSIIEGVFTADQIKLAALGVTGNTRAFVISAQEVQVDPAPAPGFAPTAGQVVVYILRDNDASIVPSQTVLDTTKQAIIDNGKLPANTNEGDLFVFAPVTVAEDFDFTALSPDTPTMRTAVTDQLTAFFEDSVDFEEDVQEASYLGAIQNTQDLQTGDFLVSFALSTPTGNIVVSDGEIAILGNVTFTI